MRVTPTAGGEATLLHAGGAIDVPLVEARVEPELVAAEVVVAAEPVEVEAVRTRVPAPPVVEVESVADRIARLEGEADERRLAHDYAAVVEIDTRILALDPTGLAGTNALYDRAVMRELHLSDPGRARADYERYLAQHSGSFAAQAQQALERLAAFPSTP